MTDKRPALKSDIDDLKDWIEKEFSEQSKSRKSMYQRIEETGRADVKHSMQISALEKRQDNQFKISMGIGLAVFGGLVKFAFSFIESAGGA